MSNLKVTNPLESPTTNHKNVPCCSNSTILKISLFVFGLFLIGGALAAHIYQVNAIVVYTMGGVGGFLILVTAIGSIVHDFFQRHATRRQEGSSPPARPTVEVGEDGMTPPQPVLVNAKNNKDVSATALQEERPILRFVQGNSTQDVLREDNESTVRAADKLVYGPEAWKKWNVDVVDVVPPPPEINLGNKDKILLYIPQTIKINDKKKQLTLNIIKNEIYVGQFEIFSEEIEKQLGNRPAPGGWVLIDKTMIPISAVPDYDYEKLKKMVESKGCSMPSVLEAVVLNFMVFAFTGERLYPSKGELYTFCSEKLSSKLGHLFTAVGNFGFDRLNVRSTLDYHSGFGAAAVQRFPNCTT